MAAMRCKSPALARARSLQYRLGSFSRRYSVQAAVCTKLGAPLELQSDWSLPPLAPEQVRVRVAAAGVNFAEILQCRGEYQEKAEPPFVPGNEAAGEVSAVGYAASAAGFHVGDRVIAVCRGGTYASELQTDRRHCLKLPAAAAGADLTEAAALLVSYGTAHLALQRARLVSGETVLVTAAAGSVGLAAVELAKEMGAARVIAACGSEAKLEVAQGRGAEPVGVNYAGLGAKEFRSKLRAVAGEQGIDVMVDMVGGDLLEAGVRSLNWNGRAVVVGFASGSIPSIPANVLLVKNVSVAGVYWGAHLTQDPATLLASADTLIGWWLEGKLKPHVCERLPLAEANRAFELVQSRNSTGKVVLIP